MNKKIVVLHGDSGAGKSTLAISLCHALDSVGYSTAYVTPIDQLKLFLSDVYEVPLKDLYTQEGKAQKVTERGLSLQDLLVKSYHFWEEVDDDISLRMLEQSLLNEHGTDVIVVESIRKPYESHEIISFAYTNDYDLLAYHLGGGEGLSTDTKQKECLKRYPSVRFLNKQEDFLDEVLVDLLPSE